MRSTTTAAEEGLDSRRLFRCEKEVRFLLALLEK
jgi:hypothetical protein